MEDRRLEVDTAVQVTLLGATEAFSFGLVTQASGDSVNLLVDKPAYPGAAIKLQKDDALFLGEVSSCRPQGQGFVMTVELQHALYNTRELAALAKRLLDSL